MERRLAAILAADIAGFSRLIGADEEGTLASQRRHRAELIDPLLAEHNGRVANTAGDSLLIEFPSAVEAVRCAIAVQDGMIVRNADIPNDRRIEYRVGINVGDVVAEGEDLLGDGVNVAARLEALAPPGGIILSGTVHDQVRDRLELNLADLGEIEAKNIARPVRAFQVLREGEAAVRAADRRTRRIPPVIATAAAVIALLLGALGWQLWGPDTEAIDPEATALALPEEPSIAVLPFQDLSETPQQWFGDGMAEDIITDLSKLSGLFVIARNSSFQYRGGDLDMKAIARQLGVAYLLEGSVRRAGGQIRINAQLIDAATAGHVWAERYDGAEGDVFALQDEVTRQVVRSLELALTPEESTAIGAVATTVPEAHDAYLQGLSHLDRRTREDFVEAKRWLDKALELDPTYADALGARADLYLDAAQRGWTDEIGISSRRETDVYPAAVEALEHPSPKAYKVEAELHMSRPDAEAVALAVERGLALAPNDPEMLIFQSSIMVREGYHAQAIELVERAMRLNPQYPAKYLAQYGWIRLVAGQNEEAVSFFTRTLERTPDDWLINVVRAPALAELGRLDEARADIAVVRENWPESWGDFTASVIAWYWGRYYGADYVNRLKTAFLKAGVPALPEGYDIRPENRLDRRARLDLLGDGSQIRGVCCGGGEWMINRGADFEGQHHWNGTPTYASTVEFLADGSSVTRTHDRFGEDNYCEGYRNPSGSNETLDAYIAVCNHGVYPYGVFPLPK